MTHKHSFMFFIVLILLGLAFWYSYEFQRTFYGVVGELQYYVERNPATGGFIFISLSALSAMFAPLSTVPFVPVAILIWGDVITSIFLLSGWLIGGAAAYFIGRYVSMEIVRGFVFFERIRYYHQRISARLEFLIVFLFRLAMPAEIPGYVLGILRYDFVRYFIATFLAELPFAVIIVYGSGALIAGQQAVFILISGVALLGLSGAFRLFERELKRARRP